MSETTAAPNNRAVVYRGKPQRERPRMPWTGQEFASRHNKALKGGAAKKAAAQASAIVAKGGDEGMAIAVANKCAKINRLKKRGMISDRQDEKKGLTNKYGGKDQQGIDAASR